jgi:hypothetical protein
LSKDRFPIRRVTFPFMPLGQGDMSHPAKSPRRPRPNHFTIAMDAWALAAESGMVIAMRMGALALGGPAAVKEAERMVSEKVAANMALGFDLMTGKLGTSPRSDTQRLHRPLFAPRSPQSRTADQMMKAASSA